MTLSEQAADRATIVGGVIEDHAAALKDALSDFVHDLSEAGCFRVHRGWSTYAERTAAVEAAVRAAVQSVLTNAWVDLPDETKALYVERAQ